MARAGARSHPRAIPSETVAPSRAFVAGLLCGGTPFTLLPLFSGAMASVVAPGGDGEALARAIVAVVVAVAVDAALVERMGLLDSALTVIRANGEAAFASPADSCHPPAVVAPSSSPASPPTLDSSPPAAAPPPHLSYVASLNDHFGGMAAPC